MPRPSIIIADRSAAGALSQRTELPIRAVIAIVDQGERPCYGFDRIERRLLLEMEDASSERSAAGRYSPRPPTREHARQIIEFARQIQDIGGILLCHCNAGLSRSPAVALICLVVWSGAGSEVAAVKEILRLRPRAQPHRGLVGFADGELNLAGRLIAAIYPKA